MVAKWMLLPRSPLESSVPFALPLNLVSYEHSSSSRLVSSSCTCWEVHATAVGNITLIVMQIQKPRAGSSKGSTLTSLGLTHSMREKNGF